MKILSAYNPYNSIQHLFDASQDALPSDDHVGEDEFIESLCGRSFLGSDFQLSDESSSTFHTCQQCQRQHAKLDKK